MRYIPGIDAQQRGAFGTQTDFSLRGSNFNQVLVLIDGQKINDPLTAHFNSNIPISPSEIERIEIIRGSASAEYGSDATGGVINIISKVFSKNVSQPGLDANAKVMYGQYNMVNTEGGFIFNKEKFKVAGGALYNKSEGNPLQSGLKGYFDIKNVSFSGQVQLTKRWSIASRYAYDFRDFNAQWFYTTSASDKATEQVARHREQIQILNTQNNSSTQILASGIQTNDYYVYTPGVAANDNTSGLYNVQTLQRFSLSTQLQLLLGGSFDHRLVKSTDRGNHTQEHGAVFASASYNPMQKLTINAGLRTEMDEIYDTYILPQVSASYRVIPAMNVRTSVGRSVRLPDFTESYSNNFRTDSLLSGLALGNPNLDVEKSWNYEAGMDIKPIRNVLLSFTGFARMAKGQIDYVYTPANQTQVAGIKYAPMANFWFAKNNSKANVYGLENRISYSKHYENSFYNKFTLGYTFLNLDIEYKEKSRYASLQPKHLINAEVITQYKYFSLTINGLFKIRDSQENAGLNKSLKGKYSVWNTNIDVAIYKQLGFVSFTAFNIFNTSYSDFLGAEMPGRWLAIGLKMKL